jgi:hypothetical protein
MALSWLIAWVRALMAESLASLNIRSISTGPSPAFALPLARPLNTARAAASASTCTPPQDTEGAYPGHQLPIASRGGRKARAIQPRTQRGQHRSNMSIGVSVHAKHDLFRCAVVVLVVANSVGHAGHGHLSPDRHGNRWAIAGPAWTVRTVTVPC